MYGFTYITTNLVNGMRYIGKRKYDQWGVWRSYLGSGSELQKAIKEFGRKIFVKEIIQWYETEEELNKAEELLVNEYNAIEDKNFYNKATGGKHPKGFHIPEESKIVISQKIKKSYTDERKKEYSDRMKRDNPNKDGHVFKGKHHTDETKEYYRQINTGRSGLSGKNNPMYGKKGNSHPLYREKSPFARSVMCIETGEIFTTCIEAGIKHNVTPSQISQCCKGVNKTCAGYHWKYINQPRISKQHNEEAKAKISKSKIGCKNPQAKPVLCVETGVVYGAAYEAGRAYNVPGEAISNCCKGRSKTSAKMHWRYLTDDEYEGYKEE